MPYVSPMQSALGSLSLLSGAWEQHGSPFPSPPQLQTGPGRSPPHAALTALPQSPWHGLPPQGSEPSGQNTCSLQTSGSLSWDSGRPGECWGWALSWASLRSRALLCCLLTPSWVCLWPGRTARAACRSAQAGRGGLPAAGFVPHRPRSSLCSVATGKAEKGPRGASRATAQRSLQAVHAPGGLRLRVELQEQGRQMEAELCASPGLKARGSGIPSIKVRLFPSLQRKPATDASQATAAGPGDTHWGML